MRRAGMSGVCPWRMLNFLVAPCNRGATEHCEDGDHVMPRGKAL